MNGRIRHLLRMELRYLHSRLSASTLGELLDALEPAWERGRETARRSVWGLQLGVDAVREDLRRLFR